MAPVNRDTGIDIPRSALRFALLQRPMLQQFTGVARRFRVPSDLVIRANTVLCRRAISDSYSKMIRADFEMIRPHLPDRVERILDIGCGIAGIDVELYRHYRDMPKLTITLLDRTETRAVPRYGFKPAMEYYNALEASTAVLERNHVPAAVVETVDATADRFPEGPLNLVVSLASWGFHYPVSTYLDPVHRALAPGGVLILDVRRGQGQEALLERSFSHLECLGSVWSGKADRYRAIRARSSPTAGR